MPGAVHAAPPGWAGGLERIVAGTRQRPWREALLAWAYRCLTPTLELPWLENFGQVTPRLWRGAQPSKQGLRQLQRMGVSTIVNLRSESEAEADTVRALGLRYVYLPFDPIGAPDHAETLEFLRVASDAENGVVFFHCYHGADRTGMLAACYRIAMQGWSSEEAIAELDRFRFHHLFQRSKLDYIRDFAAHWRALGDRPREATPVMQPV
ncbi:MAG TPA: sulfur transferase domain-containing protein [Oscillatoriaceae cyanobacterium]